MDPNQFVNPLLYEWIYYFGPIPFLMLLWYWIKDQALYAWQSKTGYRMLELGKKKYYPRTWVWFTSAGFSCIALIIWLLQAAMYMGFFR